MIEAHRTNAGYASGGLFPEEDGSSAFMDDIIFSSSLFFICFMEMGFNETMSKVSRGQIYPSFGPLPPFIPPFWPNCRYRTKSDFPTGIL